MPERNRFSITHVSDSGGRTGMIEASASWANTPMYLPTPAVLPVVDIVGGPPGPDRNGGHWRPVKWWMFLHERIPAYQCSILHPLQVGLQNANWSGWMEKPFGLWLKDWQHQKAYVPYDAKRPDNGYPFRAFMNRWDFWRRPPGESANPPLTFLESGSATSNEKLAEQYRNLYKCDPSQESILDLQLAMGADAVVSLDFPLEHKLSPEEVRQRQAMSIRNGLKLLELLSERDKRVFPYIAVHGANHESVLEYLQEFMTGWRSLPAAARNIPFGIAIGSVHYLASRPQAVIDIVYGVKEGLELATPELARLPRPPIHVLGISSRLMGILTYLGVDTFSTQTYAQVARRGQYLGADLRPVHISEVTEEHLAACGCFICSKLAERGMLAGLNSVLVNGEDSGEHSGIARYYHTLGPNEQVSKSDVYGLLAMHNWVQITREMDRIRDAVCEDRLAEYICTMVRQDSHTRHLLAAVERLSEAEQLSGGPAYLKEALARPLTARFTLPGDYQPPLDQDVLLLLESPTLSILEHIKDALAGSPVLDRIHWVALGGAQGPVPEECGAAFLPANNGPVSSQRLASFLSSFRHCYRHVIVFAESGSTRTMVATVLAPVEATVLLPKEDVTPITKSTSLTELVDELRRLPKRPPQMQLSLWDRL